jgi:hypothetical protein
MERYAAATFEERKKDSHPWVVLGPWTEGARSHRPHVALVRTEEMAKTIADLLNRHT